MNYLHIDYEDMKNGEGLRTVLWVAGCQHHCKGCQNEWTWEPNQGWGFTDETLKEILLSLAPPHIDGITFSGGDPLHPANRDTVFRIAKTIRELLPQKTIWLYTGYTVNALPNREELLSCVDVIVTEPFILELRDVNFPWAGSINQRIWKVDRDTHELTDITVHQSPIHHKGEKNACCC